MIAGIGAALAFALGFGIAWLERTWRTGRLVANADRIANASRELMRSYALARAPRRSEAERVRYAQAITSLDRAMTLYDAERPMMGGKRPSWLRGR